MNKKIVSVLLIVTLLLTLGGCGKNEQGEVGGTPSEKTIKIKIANWYAIDHPQNIALEKFKELVETNSDKQIEVQIYPNSQLGSEDTFIDSVKKGSVEMGVPGIMISKDAPSIAVAEIPFLFDSWEHARKVLQGSLGDEIVKDLIPKAGVRNLAWTVNGFREISSNREISKFEDFEGLRLRVPNVPYYVEMAKALNTNPIAMPFSELFTALEQKVVDGQDNPYSTVKASKIYEVQSHMLETRHIFSPNLWVINEEFYQSLSEENQNIIIDAAKEAADLNWELSIRKDLEDKESLEEAGIKIITPDEAFKKKLIESQAPVYQWFYDKYPGMEDLAERIRNEK
ncbi:MAG: TRAP transporter substrate-binding protein [Clostridia bacterium]|nr:TRAP transporter substrate-binding protein [Clostridia bacterium]